MDGPEGKLMTPCQGNTFIFRSSSNSLVSVSDPCRTFWADTAPIKGPQPRHVICFRTTEIQGHRQVWRARCGGPRTPSRTTDANLIVRLLKTHFYLWFWKLEEPCPPPWWVYWSRWVSGHAHSNAGNQRGQEKTIEFKSAMIMRRPCCEILQNPNPSTKVSLEQTNERFPRADVTSKVNW